MRALSGLMDDQQTTVDTNQATHVYASLPDNDRNMNMADQSQVGGRPSHVMRPLSARWYRRWVFIPTQKTWRLVEPNQPAAVCSTI